MNAAARILFEASCRRVAPLTDAELEAAMRKLQPCDLPLGAHWLHAGEVCTHAAFLANGCVRYLYANANGEEHTGQFFFEGAWLGDFASFYSGRPSNKSFQALEATQLYLLARQDLERLYDDSRNWERFGRRMAEMIVVAAQERTESLLRESLETRYLRLVRERPKVMARVPQHIIASYLGVKPESLSRLRSRLAKAGK